jgi:hypothetical protein
MNIEINEHEDLCFHWDYVSKAIADDQITDFTEFYIELAKDGFTLEVTDDGLATRYCEVPKCYSVEKLGLLPTLLQKLSAWDGRDYLPDFTNDDLNVLKLRILLLRSYGIAAELMCGYRLDDFYQFLDLFGYKNLREGVLSLCRRRTDDFASYYERALETRPKYRRSYVTVGAVHGQYQQTKL